MQTLNEHYTMVVSQLSGHELQPEKLLLLLRLHPCLLAVCIPVWCITAIYGSVGPQTDGRLY